MTSGNQSSGDAGNRVSTSRVNESRCAKARAQERVAPAAHVIMQTVTATVTMAGSRLRAIFGKGCIVLPRVDDVGCGGVATAEAGAVTRAPTSLPVHSA